MKFLELHLHAFGAFTGKHIALNPKKKLHIVFGENEAGKSTSLRALADFLFGIPPRTRDDHTHDKRLLRVGATLLDNQGQQITLVRRKGNKNTLLDTDDNPVPESTLLSMLGALDRQTYETQFGMGHAQLRAGAQALLDVNTTLSEGLYEAAYGTQTLRSTLQEIEQEADTLFTPLTRTRTLNNLLKQHSEIKKELRDTLTSHADWSTRQQALVQAEKELHTIKQQIGTLQHHQAGLTTLLRLKPMAARHVQILGQLKQLDPKLEQAPHPQRRQNLQKKLDELSLRRTLNLQHQQQIKAQQASQPGESNPLKSRSAVSPEIEQEVERQIEQRRQLDLEHSQQAQQEALLNSQYEQKHLEVQRWLESKSLPNTPIQRARIPTAVQVEQAARQAEELQRKLQQQRERIQTLQDTQSTQEGTLRKLRQHASSLVEDDLNRARNERNRQWKILRSTAVQGPVGSTRLDEYQSATDQADRIVDTLRASADLQARVESACSTLTETRGQLNEAESQYEHNKAQQKAILEEWNHLWFSAGLQADDPPAMQRWLQQLHKLENEEQDHLEKTNLAKSQGERLRVLDEKWNQQWRDLRKHMGLDENASIIEVREWISEQRRWRESHKQQKQLQDQLELAENEQKEIHNGIQQTEALLSKLLGEAGVSTIEELEHLEEQAIQYATLKEQLAATELALLGEGSDDLNSILSQCSASSTEVLKQEIQQLSKEHQELEEKREQTNQELGRVRQEQAQMEHQSAADVQQKLQQQNAAIEQCTRRYLVLNAAAHALRATMEAYRKENQGPVLQAAQEIFRDLTIERYPSLNVGWNDQDQPVLECVRFDGTRLYTQDLSVGTRDALFLALRIASIRHHLTNHSPLPVVLDDALVDLDETRTSKALQALAQLGIETQVLLFTHHRRTVELAQACLPTGDVEIVELRSPNVLSQADQASADPTQQPIKHSRTPLQTHRESPNNPAP